MTFSVLAACVGIGLGIWWYWKSTDTPRKLAQRFAGLYKVLIHKYYIDEFYNWLIVHPIHILSESFYGGSWTQALSTACWSMAPAKPAPKRAVSCERNPVGQLEVTPPGSCWAPYCGCYTFW